jgi:hypothetical protein
MRQAVPPQEIDTPAKKRREPHHFPMRLLRLVVRAGIEPATHGFSVVPSHGGERILKDDAASGCDDGDDPGSNDLSGESLKAKRNESGSVDLGPVGEALGYSPPSVQNDLDLAELVGEWGYLPTETKAMILGLVRGRA